MTKQAKAEETFSEKCIEFMLKAEMFDYPPVKGCMVIRPYGMAMWELIQEELNRRFKARKVQNANFPMLIPYSFLTREKKHIEGFAPEVALVTHIGNKELEEKLVIRPTSETIIGHMFARWIQSHRDLPLRMNQWVNVVRGEKRTRPFLRTMEFLWQEGHTAHATADEAQQEAAEMLEVYRWFAEEFMALPVLTGTKTERERFAGAENTLCIEAMMRDGKALQAGTSHFLGQIFARAENIRFQHKDGQMEHAWQTSWGVSTRLIGALVLGHADDKGLVLPPKLAPVQVVIVPIYRNEDEEKLVLDKCREIEATLSSAGVRVQVDDRDNYKPGFKFNYWEIRGVPLRINVGPRDVEQKVVELARRDTGEKIKGFDELSLKHEIPRLLETIQRDLYERAKQFREDNTVSVSSYDELKAVLAEKNVFVEAYWAGTSEDEERIKKETKATIRCIPFNQPDVEGKCILTGAPTKRKVTFALAY